MNQMKSMTMTKAEILEKYEALTGQTDALKNATHELKTENKSLKVRLKNKESKLDVANKKNSEFSTLIGEVVADRDSLKESKEAIVNEYTQFKAKIEEILNNTAAQVTMIKDELVRWQVSTANAQAQVDKLSKRAWLRFTAGVFTGIVLTIVGAFIRTIV